MNPFSHCGIVECLAWRSRLLNRLVAGSQTRLGIAAGIADEFEGKTDGEIRRLLDEVNQRLFDLDPETYEDPSAIGRPGVTRMNYSEGW